MGIMQFHLLIVPLCEEVICIGQTGTL
jgi:hypothetical protein